ncbi:cytochrome P450 4C1-like isoform X2 [Periplaneta americana]
MRLHAEFGPIYRAWLGLELSFFVSEPKYLEVIMNSNKYIDKSYVYEFLIPWMGTGLLSSTGEKWRVHRKIITPTFHFKILEKYLDVFNKNGQILVERLASHASDQEEFDISSYITSFTLDVITESAMGVSVNAQKDDSSEYAKSVRGMSHVIMIRNFSPWQHSDLIFNLSPLGKLSRKCLTVIHGMTDYVINKRKKEIMQDMKERKCESGEDIVFGAKRRLAFLDLLLLSSLEDNKLTDEEIRDEVNTFIFEGHDTTSSGISFALWVLAKYQDVQEKVVQELHTILGDSDREMEFSDLQEMKYLEQVIKETMRIYPSVPIYARSLKEDVTLGDYTLPAGSNIYMNALSAHMNPEYFPDPEKFDPDRFLPENCVGRYPYSYIPFSAGPRNCIGQKFAILEMKSTLCKLMKNYKVSLRDPAQQLELVDEMVLKAKGGVRIKLAPR